jgi:hypothetical protein
LGKGRGMGGGGGVGWGGVGWGVGGKEARRKTEAGHLTHPGHRDVYTAF